MRRVENWVAVLCLAVLTMGCSSSDDDRSPPPSENPAPPAPPPPPPPQERGSLVQNPPARSVSLSTSGVFERLTAGSSGASLVEFLAAPKCGVDVHRIQYRSVDPLDAPITSSGALMVPTGTDTACQGARPIVVYAHGTADERSFDIANFDDPDNAEGVLIAATFATQGYIVVAPNYAGFGGSSLTYHPFLNADQQAKDVQDALTAARSALPLSTAPTITDAGKLFLTGYSQGGYVAMAAHRLLQQTGATVTAAAPMSGPYALAAFGDAVFQGQVVGSAPLFLAYLGPGYQRAYGNIYTTPTDMFQAPYAAGIETVVPTDETRSALYDQGRLPRDQLFSEVPPDPAFAPYTPATEPSDLAAVFARGFGPAHLLTNAFRLAYLQDAQLNPDGGFPTPLDGLPAANPAHGLRQAFKRNDLRDWVPTAPVLLCAGNEDPTVLYMNTTLMERYWSANGATTQVRVLDVDSDPDFGDPDAARKLGFAAAKEALALAEGNDAMLDAYHSTLVPAFCLPAVQSFFDDK